MGAVASLPFNKVRAWGGRWPGYNSNDIPRTTTALRGGARVRVLRVPVVSVREHTRRPPVAPHDLTARVGGKDQSDAASNI